MLTKTFPAEKSFTAEYLPSTATFNVDVAINSSPAPMFAPNLFLLELPELYAFQFWYVTPTRG